MIEYTGKKGPIFLHLEGSLVETPPVSSTPLPIQAAQKLITKGKNRTKPLSDDEIAEVRVIIQSSSCIAALALTPVDGWRLSKPHVESIVEASPFGISICEELGRCGLFDFLQNLTTSRSYLRFQLYRLISILCLSVRGVDKLQDLPYEVVVRLFDFFRDETGLRFRVDLWKNNPSIIQALGEFARALSIFYQEPEFRAKGEQFRRTHGGRPTKLAFFERPGVLGASLMPVFSDFTLLAKGSLATNELMLMNVVDWLKDQYGDIPFQDVVRKGKPSISFPEFLPEYSPSSSNSTSVILSAARDFSKYIQGVWDSELQWSLASDDDVDEAKAKSPRKARGKTEGARPLPERYFPVIREILSEGEGGWPGSQSCCYERVIVDGRLQSIYCPVLPTLFHVLVDLPFRGAGVKRLDSGEGDRLIYDAHADLWLLNESPHAGFWARNERGRAAEATHGYAHFFGNANPPFTGINLNTNKTGFVRPVKWGHEGVLKMLCDLAKWQSKFCPIKGPLSPKQYLDDPSRLRQSTLNAMPRIFPLFRLPPHRRRKKRFAPPGSGTMSHFWARLLLEVQRRWNEYFPDETVQLVGRQAKTNQPMSPLYTIHVSIGAEC